LTNNSQRILIRGVNWIGDAVLTLPAIRAVRTAFPDSHITLLVKPWVAGLFHENRDIDEILLYNDSHKGIRGRFKLAGEIRERKFDTAILLQNAFDAAFITWLAGIPRRIGYKTDGRSLLLTEAVPIDHDIMKQHQVYYYLNLLGAIGIKASETDPYIRLSGSERTWARNLLSSRFPDQSKPLIGINPGAAYGSAKRWPPQRFADLTVKILNELNGRIVIFGGQSDVGVANEIVAEINRSAKKINTETYRSHLLMMAGKTGLRELASLIAECDVFLTNDTGPMHMASALQVPVIAMFGSTSPVRTGPFGILHNVVSRNMPCSPCMKRECPEKHLLCMTGINVDEVFTALQEMLPKNKAVFLDKDGTLIEDKNYLNSFDDLVIFHEVKSSLKKLKKAGFKLICVTNQSGIARGIVDRDFVIDSNAFLQKELSLDDSYYCPHHPDETCPCRKPEPMMLLKARSEHRINLKSSYVIGDKESDVMLAKNTGARGILISSAPLFAESCADFIANDLHDAVNWILEREQAR
jgi:heptosyltransferase-2